METPDLTRILDAHRNLRWATEVDGLLAELEQHQVLHEEVLFPALTERCDAVDDRLAVLATEHRSLKAAAIELQSLLARHLDVEENDVLPLFYRHFEADEVAVLAEAVESPPIRSQEEPPCQ